MRIQLERPSLRALFLTAIFALILTLPAEARRPQVGFLTPIGQPAGFGLVVITEDGEVLEGRVVGTREVWGSVTRMTLEEENGRRIKLRAHEIDQVIMPVNKLWRNVMLGEASETLEKVWRTDYEQIFEVDELVFHSVRHPKSERTSLRQLINPGFDQRLRVYFLPSSKEGISRIDGIPFFGDMPKAFLVVKDDGEALRVNQGDYRKEWFEQLFGDCPEVLELYQGDRRKFKFFAEHTFVYGKACPTPDVPASDRGEETEASVAR